MTKKTIILTIVLTLLFGTISVPTTVQAATYDSYAYVWTDAGNVTHYQFFKYSAKKGGYEIIVRYTSLGNIMFNAEGVQVQSDVLEGKTHIGFAKNAQAYVIGKNNALTNKSTNQVWTDHTYKEFVLDDNDIIISVETEAGNIKIENLGNGSSSSTPAPTNPTPAPTQPTEGTKSPNRIERTGDMEQTIKAFANNKIKYQLLVAGSKVLQKTANVRLSDVTKGAKFVGIDAYYNVYLYEIPEVLYRFKCGNWYTAEKMYLEGTYKTANEDANGFLKEVVTTKKVYSVNELDTTSVWTAKKTYAVNKGSYATMYVKGKTKSCTLTLKSKVLRLNGKKVTGNVKQYFFVDKNKFVLKKTNGVIYTATIKKYTKLKKVSSNGTIKPGKNGLTTYAKNKSGKKIKL